MKAMLQNEKGMGVVLFGAVALQRAKGCDQRGKVTVPYLCVCGSVGWVN